MPDGITLITFKNQHLKMKNLRKCYPTFYNTYFPHYNGYEIIVFLSLWCFFLFNLCLLFNPGIRSSILFSLGTAITSVLLAIFSLIQRDKFNTRVLNIIYGIPAAYNFYANEDVTKYLLYLRIKQKGLHPYLCATELTLPVKPNIGKMMLHLGITLFSAAGVILSFLFQEQDISTKLQLLKLAFLIVAFILLVTYPILKDILMTRYKKDKFIFDCGEELRKLR